MRRIINIVLTLGLMLVPTVAVSQTNLPLYKVFQPINLQGTGTPGSNNIVCSPADNRMGIYTDTSANQDYQCSPAGGTWAWVARVAPTNVAAVVGKIAGTSSPPTSAITVYAVPLGAAGQYRVCSQLTVTVAGTAGSVWTYINYTNQGHVYTNVQTFGATVVVTGQWNQGNSCFIIYADQSTNIQAYMGQGGVTGTPSYWYSATVERLQ